jgi:hypothetical protein
MVFLRFQGCTKPESHGLAIGTGFGVAAAEAWDDYLFWQKQDRRMVERINKLIAETARC